MISRQRFIIVFMQEHRKSTLQSGKVTNAIATAYTQEFNQNTQLYENISSKRIELIDEIILTVMKLFSDPSKFFWFKRNQK